jgi:hypothetical protein
VYSPNIGLFTFTIDGKEQLGLKQGSNRLGWTDVTVNLTKGIHVFVWVSLFRNDLE